MSRHKHTGTLRRPCPPAREFIVTRHDGSRVYPGDSIVSFRGDADTFASVTRAPELGREAKVAVGVGSDVQEFYASVYNLSVAEVQK